MKKNGNERKSSTRQGYQTEWNINNTKDPSTNLSSEDLFRGVGLMYASDYGFAVGGPVRAQCLNTTLFDYNTMGCASSDWLFLNNNYFEWLLTPEAWSKGTMYNKTPGGSVANNGVTYDAETTRPSVYLNKNVKIGEGKGTSSNPFHLVV